MSDRDLVFYVKCRVKPERTDDWLRAVRAIIDSMSREQAFVSCQLHRDAQDPTLFTLYECWAEPSVEAFLSNQDKPYRREYEALLPELLQGPREPQVLEPLGAWHRAAPRD